MSKKPTTFTEKDRKNYEEGADVVPAGSLLGQCLENQAEEDSKKCPSPITPLLGIQRNISGAHHKHERELILTEFAA